MSGSLGNAPSRSCGQSLFEGPGEARLFLGAHLVLGAFLLSPVVARYFENEGVFATAGVAAVGAVIALSLLCLRIARRRTKARGVIGAFSTWAEQTAVQRELYRLPQLRHAVALALGAHQVEQ